MKFKGDLLFGLFLFLFFIFITFKSLAFGDSARLAPLLFGSIGGILGFLLLLINISPKLTVKLRYLVKEESSLIKDKKNDSKYDQELLMNKDKWLQFLRIIGWIIGFLLLIRFTHTILAVIVFIFFLVAFEAKENWKRSLSVSLGTGTFMYILFVVILKAL